MGANPIPVAHVRAVIVGCSQREALLKQVGMGPLKPYQPPWSANTARDGTLQEGTALGLHWNQPVQDQNPPRDGGEDGWDALKEKKGGAF